MCKYEGVWVFFNFVPGWWGFLGGWEVCCYLLKKINTIYVLSVLFSFYFDLFQGYIFKAVYKGNNVYTCIVMVGEVSYSIIIVSKSLKSIKMNYG